MQSKSTLTYAEYLQLVIKQLEYEDVMYKDKVYICNVLQYGYLNKPEHSSHCARLLKTINSKLDAQFKKYPSKMPISTLSISIGYGTKARIKWLESLIKYHKARGTE